MENTTTAETIEALKKDERVKAYLLAMDQQRRQLFATHELVSFTPNDHYFVVKGRKFWIYPDAMTYDRLVSFGELLPTIIFGKTYMEQVKMMHNIEKLATTGNDILKAIHEIATISKNWNQLTSKNMDAKPFMAKYIDKVLLFCSTFILEEGENPKEFDLRKQEPKIELWRSECEISCFFLLAKISVPMLKQLLPGLQVMERKQTGEGNKQ